MVQISGLPPEQAYEVFSESYERAMAKGERDVAAEILREWARYNEAHGTSLAVDGRP